MSEKNKNNIYETIIILSILIAILTIIIKEDLSFFIFLFISIGFLTIIWFFSYDEQIKEFRKEFNKKFPFFSKTLIVIFKTFVFAIFLCSIFIIVVGAIDTFEKKKDKEIFLNKEYKAANEIIKKENLPKLISNKPVSIFNLDWSILEIDKIGKELKKGSLNFTNSRSATISSIIVEKTEGKFIEAAIKIENKHNTSILLPEFKPTFKLKDDKGRIYGEITIPEKVRNWSSMPYDEIIRKEIEPGIPYKFSVFFEVASDSNNFNILININQNLSMRWQMSEHEQIKK